MQMRYKYKKTKNDTYRGKVQHECRCYVHTGHLSYVHMRHMRAHVKDMSTFSVERVQLKVSESKGCQRRRPLWSVA